MGPSNHRPQIYRYHEKTLQQRLEMMYQRNMYPFAIELAQKAGMDAKQQSVLYRKFGDHLYQKGDYDGAMTQYIKAIDTTEPSQVIRKVCFPDAYALTPAPAYSTLPC